MTQVIIAVLTALTVIGPAIVARLAMGPGHDIKVLRELTAAINELEHPSLSRALLESARDEQASRITLRTHLAESRKRHAVTLPFSVTASIGAFVVSYHAMQQEDRLLMVGGFVLLITGLVLFAVTVRGVQLLVSTADPVPLLPKRRRRGREERSEKEDEEESGQGYAPPPP